MKKGQRYIPFRELAHLKYNLMLRTVCVGQGNHPGRIVHIPHNRKTGQILSRDKALHILKYIYLRAAASLFIQPKFQKGALRAVLQRNHNGSKHRFLLRALNIGKLRKIALIFANHGIHILNQLINFLLLHLRQVESAHIGRTALQLCQFFIQRIVLHILMRLHHLIMNVGQLRIFLLRLRYLLLGQSAGGKGKAQQCGYNKGKDFFIHRIINLGSS